jgi:hypothetical protein
MPLGAYSIVRFSNNLNDQRVNLGVLVWHPQDGLRIRLSSHLARVHAINPRIRANGLKIQLDAIKAEVAGAQEDGDTVLRRLALQFKDGVEVSSPFPAKMFDPEETLERLFGLLVPQSAPSHAVDPQTAFATSFMEALTEIVRLFKAPGADIEDMGSRRISGVHVDLGIRTKIGDRVAYWHPLSLRGVSRPNTQVAKAKVASLEMRTIRDTLTDYGTAKQYAAVQVPSRKTPRYLTESVAWLRRGADDVLLIRDQDEIPDLVQSKLRGII